MSNRFVNTSAAVIATGFLLAGCGRGDQQTTVADVPTPEAPAALQTSTPEPTVTPEIPTRLDAKVVVSDSEQLGSSPIIIDKVSPPMSLDTVTGEYVTRDGEYFLVISMSSYGGGWAVKKDELGRLIPTDESPALVIVPIEGTKENLPVFPLGGWKEGENLLNFAVATHSKRGDNVLVPVLTENNTPVVDSATITVISQ